ncbi:MAG TPA: hypothetical protein VGE72_13085 [Azospirillum sp.]
MTAWAEWGHRPAAASAARDRDIRAAYIVMLGSIFLLHRFAVPAAGSEVPLMFPICLMGFGYLLLRGRAFVETGRLILLAAFAAAATVSAVMNGGSLSWTSLALLFAIYIPVVLVMPVDPATRLRCLDLFQRFVLFVCVAGAVQFLAQFVIPGPRLFHFADIVPEALLRPGAHTVIPLPARAGLFKSNGFFLGEPSSLSQFAALGLLIEILYFRRRLFLLACVAGLVLSYSGTGLVLLAAFLPIVLLRTAGFGTAVLLGGLGLLVVIFGDLLFLDAITQRVEEFDSRHSSGFARFVSPLYVLDRVMHQNPSALLFGFGPGSIMNYLAGLEFTAHDPTWIKLLFEYGVVGFLTFSAFIGYCVFHGSRRWILGGALLFFYCFLGGFLLTPVGGYVMVLLATLLRETTAPNGAERGAAPWPRAS